MNAFKITVAAMAIATLALGAINMASHGHKRSAPEAAAPVAAPSYLMRSSEVDLRDKIPADTALPQITAESMPGMFAKLGADEIQRTRAGVWATAYRAAADRACDKVAWASLGETSEPGKPQFFARCENGVKFTFEEMELKDNNGEWFVQANAPRGSEYWISQKAFTPAARAE